MYIPNSFLSRLLTAAWTVLLISVLLWLAVRLLEQVWMWIAGIVVVAALIRLGIWWRRLHRVHW